MREWARVTLSARCAFCGAVMCDGVPMLVVTLPNLKRKFCYCEGCKGPAPPDLPIAAPAQRRTSTMKPIRKLAIDYKQRQGGDR